MAFQIVFLIIAARPVKYRLMILSSIVEKFSFTIATALLFTNGRLALEMFAAGMIDAVLEILFVVSWFKLRER